MVSKILHPPYIILRYLILLTLFTALLLLFIIEKPSVVLNLTQELLAKQNISYEKLEGGLLSGFKLTNINYQNKIKAKEVALKIDINKLSQKILHINTIRLDGLEIEKNFLSSLIDTNSSDNNQSKTDATLPFKRVIVDSAYLNLHNIQYQEYHIKSANLTLKDFESNIKDEHKGKITLALDSSVAKANLRANINNQKIELTSTINADRGFLNPLLKEHNITLPHNPNIAIDIKGDTKGLINYHIVSNQLDLNYNRIYYLKTKQLKLYGDYAVPQKNLNTTLTTQLDGNITKLQLQATSELNLNDINNSLVFDLKGDINPKHAFVSKLLSDHNLSLLSRPSLKIEAKGTLKQSSFKANLQNFKAKQGEITFGVNNAKLKGKTSILQGKTELKLSTKVDSSVANGDINSTALFNAKQLEESLRFKARANLQAKAPFLNRTFAKEQFTIIDTPQATIEAEGSLDSIVGTINADAKIKKDNIISPLTLSSSPISLNLNSNHIDGKIKLQSKAKNININLTSDFKGDYTKLDTLTTKTTAQIDSFQAFGINLNPLTPLQITLDNSALGAKATIDSKRLKLFAQTNDYDKLKFKLDTGKLYLYKMIKLSPELNHKFIQLNLKGEATLSQQFFELNGVIKSNKQFKAIIDAHNRADGLQAKLTTQNLNATLKGDLKTKNITANIKTQSLKALQKELNSLYPFDIVQVDGALKAKAIMKGKTITASITSAKLKLDGFNIEKVDIHANYSPDRITLERFNFTTTGFKEKQLNKQFYLNQTAFIHLGDRRDILIDMHPNIKIEATGNLNNLRGTAKINKLPLGHPKYGSGLLSTDILFTQKGLKRHISGDITMRQLKLFYEAKFLEADYDPDVIIITKKDKQNKEKEENAFLQHTAIDLDIKAPKATYKTADIDLNFDVNLKAKKTFGKEVALLGKIEEIEGHVDQVPKRFIIKESNIVFKGGKKINPLLDIHVEYELPQVLIGINIGGSANRPKLDFISEPIMPKKDILSYLLFGISTASLVKGEGSLSREAELFIINQAARDFAHEFDLDRIFIKDDGTREGYAIEAGKNISKSNMIIIESSKVGNSFIFEREFNKNIKLRIGQHQKEQPSQSIDLFFRKKFK